MREKLESEAARAALLEELMERYPSLKSVRDSIEAAYAMLEACFEGGNKLLVAGNGGSCADADHIVGELMKGFVKRRECSKELRQALEQESSDHGKQLGEKLQGSLRAINLGGHPGLSTAFLNDVDGNMILAQQVWGYGDPGDVLLGISTSGNAKNIDYAVTAARAKGVQVLGLTGKDGGMLAKRAHVSVVVPEQETFKIQELHLPIYHTLCLMLEERFF